ncbi:Retrovirus-related Pol polyprotein from type-1 retrotransposable element [Trichinella spiralis]|uniref:Retrovirus-related Pol polyprotein from type-1 retrotransposable element n=1 Tax=Trichinella spiralis TaxID=6334 RepID=A0ABR3KLX3_TRISP
MPQHQKSLHAALQHFSVLTATKDALKKGKRQPLRAEIAELTETYQGSCLPTFRKRSVEMEGEELPKTQRCCCADTAGIQPVNGRLPRISQKCPQTKNLYIQGHNKIVHLAAEHARREGFTVHLDQALKSGGQVYKPDLILIKGNTAHILDVAIPWQMGTDMHEHYERKVNRFLVK